MFLSVFQHQLDLKMIAGRVDLQVRSSGFNDSQVIVVGYLANAPDVGSDDHVGGSAGRLYMHGHDDYVLVFGERPVDQCLCIHSAGYLRRCGPNQGGCWKQEFQTVHSTLRE
jgi:hypothetical protein